MKKIAFLFYILVFLVAFVGGSFAQEMKPEAGKLYNEGNKMLKAGNYKGAIDNYDNALKIDQDYRIYYQKGIALKKSGNMEESKNAFESVVKLKPDFDGGYNALGGVYYSMGSYEKAIENFEKVMASSKSNNVKNAVKKNLSLAYAKMGNDALQNANTSKGVEYLQKAVENNNYDAAYLSLAKVYSEIGENDKAIAAGENALKYKSSIGKGGPYYYMGVAYKNKGDNGKAKEMFNQAKSDPTYKKLVDYELSVLK
ncbi:MAG: tetratricopeptide repeat protein [Ignavibacteriaceae bacterium]